MGEAQHPCPPNAIRNAWENKGAAKRRRETPNEIRTEYDVTGRFLGEDAVIAAIVPKIQTHKPSLDEVNNLWRVELLLGFGSMKDPNLGSMIFFIVRRAKGIDETQTNLKKSKLRRLKESAKQRAKKYYGIVPGDSLCEFEFEKRRKKFSFDSWTATPVYWMDATVTGCRKIEPRPFDQVCVENW